MHQVQSELANAYAQEFFTVRSRKARDRLPRNANPAVRLLRRTPQIPGDPDRPAPLPPRPTQTVREKCFAKCIPKPGTSLSSGEQTCIARCTDRYVDATRAISNVVLQAYSQGGAAACSERDGRTCEREKRT